MASTNDNFKFIKSSPLFSDPIQMIIPLKNGKILAFTKTEPIKVLNEELFEEEISIKENSKDEPYIYGFELSDNRICIATSKRILLISLKEKEYKIDEIIKINSNIKTVLELNDKRLIIAAENKILFYKKKKGVYEFEKNR